MSFVNDFCRNVNLCFFINFFTFFSTSSLVSFSSQGMSVILRHVLRLYCSWLSIKSSSSEHFFCIAMLLSIKEFTCFWIKLTVKETFSRSLSSSLIVTLISKSSRPEVFCKIGVLRNFAKFTGKHLYQSLLFNKVAGLRPATLLKKRLWQRQPKTQPTS